MDVTVLVYMLGREISKIGIVTVVHEIRDVLNESDEGVAP